MAKARKRRVVPIPKPPKEAFNKDQKEPEPTPTGTTTSAGGPEPALSRWRHLGADYPRWLNGETACTLRNSGSSSSEISRMLARAVDNGMPAQWVRTTM